MKFPVTTSEKPKVLRINKLDGGLNKSSDPTLVADNCLTDCKNVYFDGSKLKNRPGFFSDTPKCLRSSATSTSLYSTFYVSDTKVYLDDVCYRIAVEQSETSLADHYASMFLIDSEGNQTYTGSIHYPRTSDTIFYIPSNITFFQGKPRIGSGIFAFISLCNSEDFTDRCYEIYEVSSSLKSWRKCPYYYTPTVYINGRGDSYEKSVQSGQAFSGEPTALEAPNLLHGKFVAYFSSDGFSYSFRLPYNALDNDMVTCRIYRSPNSYTEWTITGEDESDVQSFLNNDVTMSVDRNKGIIFFTVAAGAYSVPLMGNYKANNIKISAFKTIAGGFEDVVSCTQSACINSRIVLTSGLKNNRVYSARYDNPLYFPIGEITEIGSPSKAVTALTPFNDKMLAFKETECYLVEMNKGKQINDIALVADNNATFYKYDKFDISSLNMSIGCDGKNLVSTFGNNAFVFANDGNIYSISKSGEFKNISLNVSPILKQIPKILKTDSILLQSENFLFYGRENRAVVAYFKENSKKSNDISWYEWEFPSNLSIVNGFSTSSSPVILCDKDGRIGYFALLKKEENKDTVVLTASKTQEYIIKSNFTTKYYTDEKSGNKIRLNKIIFGLKTDNKSKININGKNENLSKSINNPSDSAKNFIFFPLAASTDSVYINFKTENHFEAGRLDIYYDSLER